MRGPLLIIVAAVVVGGAILLLLNAGPRPARFPEFRLDDTAGRSLSLADLAGKPWIASLLPDDPAARESLVGVLGALHPATTVVSFAPRHRASSAGELAWTVLGADAQTWTRLTEFFRGAGPQRAVLLVDRGGGVRGGYPLLDETGEPDGLVAQALRADEAFQRRLGTLPRTNALLNGTSGALLLVGFVFIRFKQRRAHIASMLLALLATAVFLVSYLFYHSHTGSVRFQGDGITRGAYLAILISHTVLAAFVAPLAAVVVYRAARGRFRRHRALARWTLPLWLYVSISGVLIYLMLYVWFA